MKVFIALLACFAVANAYSYVYPWPGSYTYSYFCSHYYYIAPPCACYNYGIYFPKTWCQSSYYTPILKVYPGDDCGGHCWSERSVSSLTNELRNCLKSSLAKMTSQMYRNRDYFSYKLNVIHSAYKHYYKIYLYRYYAYRYSHCTYYVGSYYADRNRKVAAYCAQLDAKRASVIASFNSAIAKNIEAIKAFHEKLVKSATDCLNTRLSKISQFRCALSKKINEYVSKFISTHMAIVYKNKMHLRATYQNLFCGQADWFLGFKANVAIYDYYYRQRSRVYSAANVYRCKLNTFMNKIVSYYTCAYKCYMATGCLSYGSKYYQSHCKSLGKWYVYAPCMRYDLYCLAPLKLKFTPCHYKVLKTCNVDAAAGDISGVIADIRSKRDQFIRDFDAKYRSFRSTWVGYFLRYKAEFARIVAIRHAFLCLHQRTIYLRCGRLSYTQISYLNKMKQDLLAQASRVCYQYYQNLLARLSQADRAHADAKSKFNASIDQLISKLTSNFQACKSKRNANIAAYKKKLEDARNAQRSALSSKLYKAKSDHLNKFHVMLQHYYGSCYWKYYWSWTRWMRNCYTSLICRRISSVLSQFDAFWRTMIPKLVMHYACCYSCNVKAYIVPKCASVPCWHYCLPTQKSYSYQYACYVQYYHRYY